MIVHHIHLHRLSLLLSNYMADKNVDIRQSGLALIHEGEVD